jgi:hypothetical protein
LENLEVLTNICLNGTEILGIFLGMSLATAACITLCIGRFAASAKYFGCGLLSALAGLAAPPVVNFALGLIHGNAILSVMLLVPCLLLALAMLAASIFLLALPAYVANKRGVTKVGLINTLSGLSILLGITWPIAIALAHTLKSNNPDLGGKLDPKKNLLR